MPSCRRHEQLYLYFYWTGKHNLMFFRNQDLLTETYYFRIFKDVLCFQGRHEFPAGLWSALRNLMLTADG